jgi:hypothetical protein
MAAAKAAFPNIEKNHVDKIDNKHGHQPDRGSGRHNRDMPHRRAD